MVKVEGLDKIFDPGLFEQKKHVLKNLSFQVRQGKTTGFVGVNGAGKTTTLKCILGFIHPNKGEVEFFNEGPLTSEVKTRIGYLPERPYYYEFLKASEFLRFHWQLSTTKKNEKQNFESRAQEILQKVNLSDVWDRQLRSFSKGMLQRIGLAQALLRRPEFLILDEPMSGLDPDGRILIKDIILEEKLKGTTIFFSSHLLGDMDELCDDLVVINQGELQYQGELKNFAKEQGVEKSFRELREKLGGLKGSKT
jgi:ABC-2 type transport system ATP-binding protein